ncbi:MAG TPA: acyltransferase [Xanthobacteraceae bacterium]|nr:acyltransferase [Xanthobacteraceae bacterium]
MRSSDCKLHLASPSVSRTSTALENLRGIVILLVIGFHTMLAYVMWMPAGEAGFDQPPFSWRAFPIVDAHRFFGFDLFCAWQDVFLMSLLFFLSGLFVWPSLQRKKGWAFLRDRMLRLGLPYMFGIAVIIPLALYPAYSVRAADPSVTEYWHALLALPFWPNGPLWFVWQLLALNLVACALYAAVPHAIPWLGRWSATAGEKPLCYFGAVLTLSALAYAPLAVVYTPWAWTDIGPFTVQICRPLLYAVYFFAGVGVGAAGIERGLLAADGILARRWASLLTLALLTLFVWMGLTALTVNGGASLRVTIVAALSFVPASAAGCFFLIAVCLRFVAAPSRLLGRLGRNAYALYLVHYVFVVWLQFVLLPLMLPAAIKAPLVFVGSLCLSLVIAVAARSLPFAARLIGSQGRMLATS